MFPDLERFPSGAANPYTWVAPTLDCFGVVLLVVAIISVWQSFESGSGVSPKAWGKAASKLVVRILLLPMTAVVGLSTGMLISGYVNSLFYRV